MRDDRPTLSDAGIDKKLSSRAQKLAAVPAEKFEGLIGEWRQVREIGAAGFAITPQRVVSETVSGGVAAGLRLDFARLLERLEAGDVLVVTKLDRLGRNVIDVRQTVEALAARGVRVHCLALGGVDLC